MDADTAREVLNGAIRSAGELQRLLPKLGERCPPDEYKEFLRAVASVLGELTLQITNRVTKEHPGLADEVEARIAEERIA